ncbi:MAG: nucleoside 2-deoxyribosyltransferase [Ignavibacteriaceae bacterium]|jgi:hypothetical protein|nr:nucleoside 2-deoxyribosyltransferase [Ignavibacteriaceae bacterium]MCU0364419.1 nucleoside 2-deoxyribosyltransferase [Ignavibacteriaceae bacterium]MCU0413125.1 nucleoside 2-deoxyribosyltransferase [Ignavibacteriaceae bacterium]
MIIYCTGTKWGSQAHQKLLKNIIEFIESLGHTALAAVSSKFSSTIPLSDQQTYKRNLKWIDGSKLVIAEISNPDLETGIEIAYALYHRKVAVLALHVSSAPKISSMLTGCDSPLLTIQKYGDTNEMQSIIKTFLSKIS